ncbi:MAG: UDP-N-acetylmuramoyl-tripeptide--D-alanyl-D-alanine ligase [Magnetococcales bacterium]|nr:UDP-N-acetylmuramoyl-tripeptide--D-alanyl-D-alanine ligase [Magnetococcales bacterium]
MRLSFIRESVHAPAPAGEADPELTGVSTDSRRIRPGELFAALSGPNFDGHDYIDAAVERGCAAVLAARLPATPVAVPVVLVPDVLHALGQAGTAWRHRVAPLTIAVTGSSGKTTVKEMIATCLARQFTRIHATSGNLNNHIGVPLTLLAMPADCQALVVEMGMSAPGEIAHLTRLAQPDLGVITNIQPAHMAAFASIREVALAKGELFANLPAGGTCLVPLHDANAATLLEQAAGRRIVTHGPVAEAMVRWEPEPETEGICGTIRWSDGIGAAIRLGPFGPHMIHNALAAASAARTAGVTPQAIAGALSGFTPLSGRGIVHRLLTSQGLELSVIDDTYNANPGSTRAALIALAGRPGAGRRVAILGDMLELGETAEELHKGLAEEIRLAGVALLITAGPLMLALHDAVTGMPDIAAHHQPDPASWVGNLLPLLRNRDAILVKGSRGMRMERIVKDLMNHAV